MVELTLPVVLQLVQTTALLVGIFYYIMTLRNSKKSRDAQIFLQFSNRMGSEKWQNGIKHFSELEFSNYQDFEKYRDNNPEELSDIRYVLSLLEDFGGLVRGGYLDISIIAYTTFSPIKLVWEKLLPVKDEWRTKVPRMWSEIEYLYDQLHLYKQKNPKLFK